VLPLVVVLVLPALDALAAASRRTRLWAMPALGLAVAWSAAIAVHGAMSPATRAWNYEPTNVDHDPARVWDWRDPQPLRGRWPW
jgi:hypothetical protein